MLVAAFMMSSCIKENLMETPEGETTTVTLHIAGSRNNATEDANENEGFKTLRVIMTDADGKVEINYMQTNVPAGGTNGVTLSLKNITQGQKTFYVIGNEKSIGWEGDNPEYAIGRTLNTDFLDTIIEDDDRTYFPKLRGEIGRYGLPITGYKTMDINNETTDVEIFTYHAVAKVSLSFINNTSSNIVISGLNLGQFMANRAYLFPGEDISSQRVPLDVKYDTWSYPRSYPSSSRVTIQKGSYKNIPGNKNLIEFYVYETNADPEHYTIAMTTSTLGATGLSESRPFLAESEILRNQWVQVEATINNNAVDVDVVLTWSVRSWNIEEIEVPPFN